jgi:predicted CXXCH cytochrome family protein
MRDWAGGDGVRGATTAGREDEARDEARDAGPAGADQATLGGPQGRRSWTRSASGSRARAMLWLELLALAVTAVALVAAAPSLHRPRTPEDIKRILSGSPHTGECDRCHTIHGGEQALPQPNLLLAPDDNTLCTTCHSTAWEGGSFGGPGLYAGTGHGSSTTMVWPGPTPPMRTEIDAAGKCLNCHDPHGYQDATGLIPFLALQREESLCLNCHGGAPATTNIRAELQKPYRHPVTDYAGRHTGPTESLPSDFGAIPMNQRHSECEDCHDPHVSRPDVTTPMDADLSKTTLGASRVTVFNGVAGAVPTYTFVPGSDTLATPATEYTLCFKCHSSWTNPPAGQTDFARVLNPANPSFHPVEDRGRNANINPLSFVNGWSPLSVTRCGDCHGSDFGNTRGPHGSIYRFILKQPYTASSDSRAMASNEICFACHSYDVYANRNAPEAVRGYSRFNAPGAGKGHAEHVDEESVPCYACHVTHGSTTQRHLMVTGRNPGISSYAETSNGGTCSPTCHGGESYTVNYAR